MASAIKLFQSRIESAQSPGSDGGAKVIGPEAKRALTPLRAHPSNGAKRDAVRSVVDDPRIDLSKAARGALEHYAAGLSNLEQRKAIEAALQPFSMRPDEDRAVQIRPSRVLASAKTGAAAALADVAASIQGARSPDAAEERVFPARLYAIHRSPTDKSLAGYLAFGGIEWDGGGAFQTFAVGVGFDGKQLLKTDFGM